MSTTFDSLIQILHNGVNPYVGFPADKWQEERFGFMGWPGYFEQAIDKYQPDIYIEFGSLYGASARHAAQRIKTQGHGGVVIMCDTFEAEEVLWGVAEHRERLQITYGRATAYERAMKTILVDGLQDTIIPLVMDTGGSMRYLKSRGVTAPIIYIDACHVDGETYRDMRRGWPILRPGGTMILDDYQPGFPELVHDVNQFAAEQGLKVETEATKVRIVKP